MTETKRIAILVGTVLTAATLPAQAQVKLGGYTHFDYYRGDNGNSSTLAEQEFIARRVRLNASARINDMVRGVVGLQADDSSSTGARGTALKDLILELRLHPWAQVRAGVFKYQFDIEAYESSSRRWFMNRAIVVNNVASSLVSGSGDARDKGLSLSGGAEAFGYGLGLFQGQGSDSRDSNSKFGYTANVWGKLGAARLNAGYLASDNTPQGTSTINKYDAYTLGAAYGSGPFVARAEYYRGERTTASTQDKSGYYVMAGYSITSKVDLMARYQQYRDEVWTGSDNEVKSMDLGVKYHIVRNGQYGNANVSLNYMRRDAGANVTQRIFDERGANLAGGNIGDILTARLQLDF